MSFRRYRCRVHEHHSRCAAYQGNCQCFGIDQHTNHLHGVGMLHQRNGSCGDLFIFWVFWLSLVFLWQTRTHTSLWFAAVVLSRPSVLLDTSCDVFLHVYNIHWVPPRLWYLHGVGMLHQRNGSYGAFFECFLYCLISSLRNKANRIFFWSTRNQTFFFSILWQSLPLWPTVVVHSRSCKKVIREVLLFWISNIFT